VRFVDSAGTAIYVVSNQRQPKNQRHDRTGECHTLKARLLPTSSNSRTSLGSAGAQNQQMCIKKLIRFDGAFSLMSRKRRVKKIPQLDEQMRDERGWVN
jgi:hypothetical protein